MKASHALLMAAANLKAVGILSAAGDARRILGHILASNLIDSELQLDEKMIADFHDCIAQRAAFRPVSQIIGYREFWGRKFSISQDVLDPRPETETLIERALEGGKASKILDLGTGSGVLAITMLAEWPHARAIATDISTDALEIAQRNADSHGVASRLILQHSDWFIGVEGQFDLILCNPPYISAKEMRSLAADILGWEPAQALTPGGDGLGAYRKIARGLRQALLPRGRAIFEIGHQQAEPVAEIFGTLNLGKISFFKDLNNHYRVVEMQKLGD